MAMATNGFSLPYHEPSITVIAILAGFILLLNALNYCLDKLIYCGLLAQVFLGIAWGTPGAKWLSNDLEHAVVHLGYLGLILLVFEGGLSTSYKSLKANLLLSIGVAITGIAVPIGFSFTLGPIIGATPLQAFAAGAALCSTSLGTTFTVLSSSGLTTTRLGVVLTSAAMMDDVVGLIMVQVVANLGGGSKFDKVTVIRPVFVSLGFMTLVPAACRFIIGPITVRLNGIRERSPGSKIDRLFRLRQTALVIHTCWLFGLVVAGTFAGTSSLLAAYVAGETISWWDSEVPHCSALAERSVPVSSASAAIADRHAMESESPAAESPALETNEHDMHNSGLEIYELYYGKAVEHILKPFFFASIGFSIPIAQMFPGTIVWRGIVYTIMMVAGKMLCGMWLLSPVTPLRVAQNVAMRLRNTGKIRAEKIASGAKCAGNGSDATKYATEAKPDHAALQQTVQDGTDDNGVLQPALSRQTRSIPVNASPGPEMPASVYPACILGLAMVARGEIGFLISALAESTGIFSGGSGAPDRPSELFLVVTWAITLCTIIGPVCVGLLVARVKRLEVQREGQVSRNPLGAWGVN